MKRNLFAWARVLRWTLRIAPMVLMHRWAMVADAAPLPREHILFHADFEDAEALRGWHGVGKIEAGYQSRGALGVEHKAGGSEAWFDDVKWVVARPPVPSKPAPVSGAVFTGRNVPRLRGAMIGPDIDAEGLRVLGRDWGANLIRWQLIRPGRPAQPASMDDYDVWLDGELRKLDAALPHCLENGLHVVVDLHSPPGGKGTAGGYVGSDDRLFTDPACQEKFVRVWEQGVLGGSPTARHRLSTSIWRAHLHRRVQRHPLGPGRQCCTLSFRPDRYL